MRPVLQYLETTVSVPCLVCRSQLVSSLGKKKHAISLHLIHFYSVSLFWMRAPTDNGNIVCTGQWLELKEKDLQLYKQMRTPDCFSVLALWVLQYMRGIPSSPVSWCHGQKKKAEQRAEYWTLYPPRNRNAVFALNSCLKCRTIGRTILATTKKGNRDS